MNLRAKLGLLTFVVLSLALALHAESITQLKPTGYVNDFAHVLDSSTSTQITDIARQVDEKAHAQIALVTINTLDGRDVESYAVDLFKQWGIGNKSTNRGVLILYAIRDRRARVEVGYGLEPILPDGKVGSFQREAIPQMQRGDYSGALLLVTQRIADVIASDAGVQLTGGQPRAPAPVSQPDEGFSSGAVIWTLIVIVVLMFTPLRRVLFWFLISQFLGGGGRRGGGFGGGGGWSSGGGGFGGFGGGDSGGGFGGFGGGSSGGGGASSSW